MLGMLGMVTMPLILLVKHFLKILFGNLHQNLNFCQVQNLQKLSLKFIDSLDSSPKY